MANSLAGLGIDWEGSPKLWNTIPRTLLPECNMRGEVMDASGVKFSLTPVGTLGNGTFGIVEEFIRSDSSGKKSVAMKRPTCPKIDLLLEALFQWKLHRDLEAYGISFTVPEVYDIFRDKRTGDIWFTMEAFRPFLVSQWCVKHLTPETFPLLLLQIGLILEVFQNEFKIDHRDLKINNMLVVEEPVSIEITWEDAPRRVQFPFRVVFIDFGFACIQRLLDIREGDGLPPVDACPKEGRDIFQVLVSLWSIPVLRNILDSSWGSWIRQRIGGRFMGLVEKSQGLDWMYNITDDREFRAPLCAPFSIIQDCIKYLEGRNV
jgi:serine/threonine protein kinase